MKQEYLNPGIPEGEDKERAENARWERLLEIAERTNDNRPVMTSEYAHCMGNALGNFKEYWDEIYSNPVCWAALYGTGWIKGIYKILPDGRRMVAYGGDFGDRPNLKAFCFNGVVMSDRETTPKYWEVKKVYARLNWKWKRSSKGFPKEQDVLPKGLRVTNRNHHIGLGRISLSVDFDREKEEDETKNWRFHRWHPVKQERWLCPMLRLINRLMFD